MRGASHTNRFVAGIPGSVDIPLRGLQRNQAYLFKGSPGREEITLAAQFISEGKWQGESCFSMPLSESNSLT